MYFLTRDHSKLYYEIRGNTDAKRTVLFLNGISQTTRSWNRMVPEFEKNYRVILCDFIFQGQSAKDAPYRTLNDHAGDIRDLIQELGLHQVNPIGISFGSLVAQHLACNFPELCEKLVLISTFAHKTPRFESVEFAWERALDLQAVPGIFDFMNANLFGESFFQIPLFKDLNASAFQGIQQGEMTALRNLMKAIKEERDYRKDLEKIRQPLLVIHGADDLLVSLSMAKEVAASVTGSRLEVIPKAGHTLNAEAPDEACELILDFLQKP